MDGCKQENKMTTGYEKEDVMKREGKRITAWIMAFIMVWSLVMVPGGQAQAAETTKQLTYTAGSVTETGNTSNQVSRDLGNGGYSSIADLKSAGVTKLRITFEVTSATASGSSTVGAQAFINAKDLWEGQWVNVSAGSGEQTVELDLTQYYTSSAQLYNFGFQFENVSSITYQIKNAELVLGGTSGGSSGGGESSDFGTSRDYSSEVTATLTNQKDPTKDWSAFDMTINNNSGSSICDWIVVLQVPSGTASKFKCWNATFVANGDTIYMYPMQTGKNAVLSTGTMQNDIPGGGFSGECVDASSIQVKEVYYNKGTSSSYDYSNGDTNDETGGNGGSGGSGSGSAPDSSTNKDLDVEYNYAKVLQESLYFYDANMCGNLEGKCALSWRGNCHTKKDSSVTYTNNGKTYTLDVSGGFHDAGDHVKFGLPQGYAASMLGMSYYQFKDAFEELGQTEHLKTITDYFCDYFKRCTVYEGNDVIAFCYQVGDGGSDHAIWSAPENQDGLERPAFFADASNPATDEVSVAIAALALNYKNFGNAEDLKVAKDLYAFVQKNSKSCATTGAYPYYHSQSYGDDLALAASALMVATGDSSYNTVYNEYKESGNNGVNQYWVLDWANSGAMACMLQKDSAKLKSITEVCTQKGKIDGVFNCVSDWGSCRYSAAEQFTGLVYDKLMGTSTFKDWAISQMNYMIGDNPNKRCYIVGYNENSSKYPHHRAASNSTGDKVYNKNHYTLLGAVVGGPGSGGQYYDKQEDYHCNEVALDYNAGLVGAAAGLYLVSKNSDTTYLSYAKRDAALSKELASAEEISAVGVTKYYGTSSTITKATAIAITSETLSLTEGESKTLSATVIPAEANQKVTWTSSNKTVATVDTEGKVTAKAAGDAEITATTKDGTTLTATCAVTVTAAPKAELVAESTSISCDELEYGYTTGSSASVVINNQGNADANTTIAMEKGSASAFTLTGAVSAIAAGEKATLTVQAKTGLAAGAYTDNIKVTYGENELSIPVTVNVSKRAITITADNKEKTYGNANPQLTYQITSENLIKGDSVDVTLSTSAKTDSDAGTYEIEVTTGTNANYNITPVNGTLTVNPKEITDVVFPTAGDIEVGESLAKASLTGGSTEYGTFAWVDSSVTPERGTYSGDVKLTLSDTAKKNYTFSNVTGYEETTGTIIRKVSVNVKRKGLPAITFPSASGLVYGQKLSDAVLTGGSTEYGTFTWDEPERSVNENDIETGSLTATMIFEWNDAAKMQYGILDQDEDARLTKDITVNVAKADCTQTAEKPVLVKRTSNSITVNTVDGVEYSLNGKDWIQKKADESTVTFTGLSAFTKYSVVARYAETATHKAGAVSDKTDVYTLVEDPYVIDVSKATDANYMDALRDEDGTTTATLADNVLTLDKKDKTYTICGNNEDITVKAENVAKIIFKDAKIKDLVIANTDDTVNTIIQIDKASDGSATDDVVIKGGIKADKGSVTITGDGKLSSGRIEATGFVTIEDANISVSGEKDVPAIKGDKVTIKDSTVKADVPKDSSKKAIESGNITLIGNNDISSTDGDKDIYSSEPKDENGQVLTQYEVKYLDSDGNEVKASEKVYKGTEVTLPKVPAKKGYAGKWKDASGKVYEVGTKQVVTDAVTYTVTYEKILVTKITLDSTSETLTVGDNTTLTATVTPDDAFDTSVQWSTNNAKVATVTDGTVTAVAAGTAEITATAKDGSGVKATCRITVLAKATQDSDQKGDKDPKQNDSDEDMDNDEPVDVAKITITGITRKVAPGKRIALKANIFPANADNQDVTWSIRSADKKYATVNSKGVVSVKKSAKGRKIVVMATSDEDDSIQAVYKITVMKQAVKKVKLIAKTKKIKVKKSTTIKAVLSPSKGISNEVSWTSSNPKIATVNAKGKVTGIKKGKVKITATAKDGSGRKAKITIQVK